MQYIYYFGFGVWVCIGLLYTAWFFSVSIGTALLFSIGSILIGLSISGVEWGISTLYLRFHKPKPDTNTNTSDYW